MIAYKIMVLLDSTGLLHSLADRRLTLPLNKGAVLAAPGGIWLGSTIDYVQSYYGSTDPNDPEEMSLGEYEIQCAFQFDPINILRGTVSTQGLIDKGNELAVSRATLVSAFNVTTQKHLL